MSSLLRSAQSSKPASVWPHRLSIVLNCATFALLLIGGLVTSKGAGLAVPDWPTTFGYNMFLYPWSRMVGDVFYEHSHRLVASAVGLITIAVALTLWFSERRQWLRWLGIAALAMVIAQGIIGGLRVVLLEHTLAIVHAALAHAFFALTASLVVFTSSEWSDEPTGNRLADGGRLWRLCAATTGLIYLQAIFGAVLRHSGARLDAHLLLAGLVTLHVMLMLVRILKFHSDRPELVRPSVLLGILLLLQLMLGAGSYFGKFTILLQLAIGALVSFTTAHLLTGALLLVVSLWLTLRSYRFSASTSASLAGEVLTEQFSS
jgi:cytochrome c oxidase assembly protein subunit 15